MQKFSIILFLVIDGLVLGYMTQGETSLLTILYPIITDMEFYLNHLVKIIRLFRTISLEIME